MAELQNSQQSQEETIDIKAILFKYSHYWYYFIISVLFCLFIAFLYNRYSKNISYSRVWISHPITTTYRSPYCGTTTLSGQTITIVICTFFKITKIIHTTHLIISTVTRYIFTTSIIYSSTRIIITCIRICPPLGICWFEAISLVSGDV